MLVDEDYLNRRIDKYLRDKFGYLQSRICVLAKQKKILVNKKTQNFNYRLQKGDRVNVLDENFEEHFNRYFRCQKKNVRNNRLRYDDKEIYGRKNKGFCSCDEKSERKDAEFSHLCCNKNKTNFFKNARDDKKNLPVEMVYKVKQSVVFENDDVLVINKPYGISVQGGTGVKYSLEDYFPFLSEKKLRIVHRIDKDTRGLLILAKNLQTAAKLTDMFRKRGVYKKYLAVLSNIPVRNAGTIKTHIVLSNKDNIASNAHSSEERMNGKEAITKYKVIKVNRDNNTALVEFYPLTGRKHQIRLHSQHIKCPIVGDEKYGFGKQKNKKLQLFAVSIDASPVVKVELGEKDLKKMINF